MGTAGIVPPMTAVACSAVSNETAHPFMDQCVSALSYEKPSLFFDGACITTVVVRENSILVVLCVVFSLAEPQPSALFGCLRPDEAVLHKSGLISIVTAPARRFCGVRDQLYTLLNDFDEHF